MSTPVASVVARSLITVHHLNNSRSQRLLWLLEELEVPYTIKKYERGADRLAPKELKAIHPLGKAPVITDGDTTIAESGAIVQYIIEKYANGKADPPEAGKLDDLYWTHYAEGSLMPILVSFLHTALVSGIFSSLTAQLVNPQLKTHCDYIESHLAKTGGGWFAGGEHPTAADYMMEFPLDGLSMRAADNLGPNTMEYIKRIHERPAYKRAIEKGGELNL